jgi:hypothetical protein
MDDLDKQEDRRDTGLSRSKTIGLIIDTFLVEIDKLSSLRYNPNRF